MLLFSRSLMSNSLKPHGLQHTRPPCPSPPPRVCTNSCPLSRCCHPTISSSAIPLSCLQSFPASGSNELVSFSLSISTSNEYSGLISFRIDWFDLLAVQGTRNSLPQHHSLKVSIIQHSTFFMVQLSYPFMTPGKTMVLTTWPLLAK